MRAWSWSALSGYETCPKQHYELKVTKSVREKKSEALTYGLSVHKALERRLKRRTPLPEDLSRIEPRVAALEALGGVLQAEKELAVREDMTMTDWFGRDVWARSKLDVVIHLGNTMIIVDWKTGKIKDDWGQLNMAAHLNFTLYPELSRIGLTFVWTKYNDTSKKIITREQAALTWASEILPRVQRYQTAHDTMNFPPKPSGLCRRHCPVKSCQYHGTGLS